MRSGLVSNARFAIEGEFFVSKILALLPGYFAAVLGTANHRCVAESGAPSLGNPYFRRYLALICTVPLLVTAVHRQLLRILERHSLDFGFEVDLFVLVVKIRRWHLECLAQQSDSRLVDSIEVMFVFRFRHP